MITIHELLEDEDYKKFFCKPPQLPEHLKGKPRNYRLYVLLEGNPKWKFKNFSTYVEAFRYFAKIRHKVRDAAICSPGLQFEPPSHIVRVKGKYFQNKDGSYKLGPDGKKIQVTRLVYWKPVLPLGEEQEHHWCPYCRRPTVFQQFRKHHAISAMKLGGVGIDSSLLRCTICGSSENIVNLRKQH